MTNSVNTMAKEDLEQNSLLYKTLTFDDGKPSKRDKIDIMKAKMQFIMVDKWFSMCLKVLNFR